MNVGYRDMVPADMHTVLQHMPFAPSTDTRGMVAYDEVSRETLAIFIAHSWTETSVQVHQLIIKPMVIRHGWFYKIADWIFGRAEKRKMYGLVPENNHRAISINEKIGFKPHSRLVDAVEEGIDFVLMELKREDCRYWNPVKEAA